MSAIRTPSPPPKRSQNVTVPGATGAPVIPAPKVPQPPSARAPAPTAEARRKERRGSDAGGWMSFSFRNVLTGSPSCSTRGSAPPCSAGRTGVGLGGQVRPAPAIPADRADAEPEVAGPGGVVVVVREVVAVHRLAAGTDHRAVLGEDHRAASVQEWRTELVDVGPRDRTRSPDSDLVGAVEPPAAEVEGDEQVVVAATTDDVGSFDRVRRDVPVGETERFGLTRCRLAGRPLQGEHPDPAPEGAERHPRPAPSVLDDPWVDGVVVVLRGGLRDETAVDPVIGRVPRV